MSFLDGEIFQKIVDPSGQKMLEVIKRPDGIGRFVESTQEHDEYSGDYWSPSYESGLYLSAEEAFEEARKILSWLRSID
ncbi:MAG: hypothetical protein ABS76_33770 [Pelagibacterium sp. SCN 64-44]|nr:MAG: hypothetical protein ABS76_33770 [Pelagibacterium sp. SCN 64-44]